MKIKRHREQLAAAAHQDNSTPEIVARTEQTVHRRTTVTVERETVSLLIRRPVEGAANQPSEAENAPIPQAKDAAATPPGIPDGGKQ